MGVGVMIHSVECATRPPLVPVIGIGEHLLPEAVVEERFSCLRSNSRVPLRTARAIWNNDRVASCNQPHFRLAAHDGDSLARSLSANASSKASTQKSLSRLFDNRHAST